LPWEDVKKEMVHEKGLEAHVADRIGEYVKLSGSEELCDKLLSDTKLSANESAKQGIEDMKLLFKYLTVFNIKDKISFDLSLARGLDYYTGIIYEAVFNQASAHDDTVGIGSIAAGGRYDELVGMFSGGKKIPCVGASIGVERVFSLLLRKAKLSHVRSTQTQVFVIAIGELVEERMAILRELWDAGICAEMMFKKKPKLPAQWTACDKDQVPLAIIIGGSEVEQGVVKIKDMTNKTGTQEEKEVTVKRSDMVAEVKKKLGL
jgi:histidyl-tRNA synthetase